MLSLVGEDPALINLLTLRDLRCCYNLILNFILDISVPFWCKYMAINLIFQTKNIYSNISKNYKKGNICFASRKTIYYPLVLLVDYTVCIRVLYRLQYFNLYGFRRVVI